MSCLCSECKSPEEYKPEENTPLGIASGSLAGSVWISVEDRLPKHGVGVLITDGEVVTAATADFQLFIDGRIWWDGCGFSGHEWDWDFDVNLITHWMPLPDLPKT